MSREVKEETGLNIKDDGRLAFITQVDAIYETMQTVAFIFDISAYDGTIMPADPDQLIHDAEFVPIDEAIQRLARVKWASMREPLIAYLSENRSFKNVWQYRQHSFSDFQLIVGQQQN